MRTEQNKAVINKAIEAGTYFWQHLEKMNTLPSVKKILNHEFYKFFYTIDADETLRAYMLNLKVDSLQPGRDKAVLEKMHLQAINEAEKFCDLVEKAKQELNQCEFHQAHKQFQPENEFEKKLHESIRPRSGSSNNFCNPDI